MSTRLERFLLDTNIIVHLMRNDRVWQRIDTRFGLSTDARDHLISIVTVGEARSLATQLGWSGARTSRLESLFRQLVIVPLDVGPIVDHYARIDTHSRGIGRRMGKNDAWIAATAAVTSTTLITTDRDFEHLESMIKYVWIDPS